MSFIHKFYRAFPLIIDDSHQMMMTVRSIPFTFSDNLFANLFNLPRVFGSEYPNINRRSTQIASTLCGSYYKWDGKKAFSQRFLTPFYKMLNFPIGCNILPRCYAEDITLEKATLIYCLGRVLQ